MGARLEQGHAPALDSLHALLTALDMVLRLARLEVLELRSLDWR